MSPPPARIPDADVWPVLRDTLAELRLLGAHHLRRYHLSVGQAFTMHRILASGGLRLSALAEGLGISRPAASELVTSLEEQGWARRVRSPTDRRGVEVRLTPRALDLLATFDHEFESIVRSATEELPRDLRVPTVTTLTALRTEMRTRNERIQRSTSRAR
jgi:MarR family transcriptional regulator, organic hydroperoxide resistance regulator